MEKVIVGRRFRLYRFLLFLLSVVGIWWIGRALKPLMIPYPIAQDVSPVLVNIYYFLFGCGILLGAAFFLIFATFILFGIYELCKD